MQIVAEELSPGTLSSEPSALTSMHGPSSEQTSAIFVKHKDVLYQIGEKLCKTNYTHTQQEIENN